MGNVYVVRSLRRPLNILINNMKISSFIFSYVNILSLLLGSDFILILGFAGTWLELLTFGLFNIGSFEFRWDSSM